MKYIKFSFKDYVFHEKEYFHHLPDELIDNIVPLHHVRSSSFFHFMWFLMEDIKIDTGLSIDTIQQLLFAFFDNPRDYLKFISALHEDALNDSFRTSYNGQYLYILNSTFFNSLSDVFQHLSKYESYKLTYFEDVNIIPHYFRLGSVI